MEEEIDLLRKFHREQIEELKKNLFLLSEKKIQENFHSELIETVKKVRREYELFSGQHREQLQLSFRDKIQQAVRISFSDFSRSKFSSSFQIEEIRKEKTVRSSNRDEIQQLETIFKQNQQEISQQTVRVNRTKVPFQISVVFLTIQDFTVELRRFFSVNLDRILRPIGLFTRFLCFDVRCRQRITFRDLSV